MFRATARSVNHSAGPVLDIFRQLTAIALPLRCTFCSSRCAALPICAACRAALPWNDRSCPRCAQPQTHEGLCARCAARPPPFIAAFAPLRLDAPVQQQIHALKYAAAFMPARLLGQLFAEALSARGVAFPDLVLPVPLHPQRLRRRGYNQSVELARPLKAALGLRIEPGYARRIRATTDQIGMGAAARRRNVAKAFAIDARVRGLRIALLDDVMTTGATQAELARCCLRAGALQVEAWAIARVA